MERGSVTCLTWQGRRTVQEVKALLGFPTQIEIALPLNYNHTLFHKLHPDAPAYALQELDESAGPELLSVVATVNGLEEFAELVQPVHSVDATVTLVSPPRVIIRVPAKG